MAKQMLRIGTLMVLGLASSVVTAQQAPADPLKDGMSFYAPLDGTVDAAVALGKKAPSKQNDLKFVDGKFGQGVELKDKAMLYYPGEANISLKEGTVAFWCKRHEKWSESRNYILLKAIAGEWNKQSLYLMVTEFNQLRVWIYDDNGKQYLIMSDKNIPYAANEWYHVAMTFKDGEARLFVNGAEITYGAEKCAPKLVMPSGVVKNFQLGTDYTDKTVLNGVMDDVRVYSKALSLEDVKKLHELKL